MKTWWKNIAVGAILAVASIARAQSVPDVAGESRFTASPESIMQAGSSGEPTGKAGGVLREAISGIASLLFAPAFAGDGQTANWRIIDPAAAGRRPWTAVGNFLIPGLGGYCTAVLVAPRIVVTANHCLYAPDYNTRGAAGGPGRQLMEAKRFVFVAGVHDGSFADRIPVEEVITGGWAPGAEETSRDWAIAILARPAASDIVPIAFRSYDPKAVPAAWRNKAVVAAYPGAAFAFSTVLRFSINCSILPSDSTDVVIHDCASDNGSSGGPILVAENGEPKLIGIHSSRTNYSRVRNGVSVNSFLVQLNEALARYRQDSLAAAGDR